MTVTETPTLRWSSVRDCGRKAVLEATTEPDRDWTRQERGYMMRGKSIGRDFVLMLSAGAQEGGGNGLIWVDSGPREWVPVTAQATKKEYAAFVAELRVPWEMGVGHVDCYIPETGTVIEILSSAQTQLAHSKLLQAIGYARKIDDAKAVCLVIVNPSDLTEERVIVTRDSDTWNALVEEVEERIAAVIAWRETGMWPQRVCGKPSEARGHFCRHAETCFNGWQPDPLAHLEDAETHEFVARLYHAKQKEREVKQTLGLIEAERKEIEKQLDGLVDPGKFQVGGFQIVKSPRRKESFKLTLAKKDSRLPAALLDEFTSVSEFTVWSVDRAGAGDIDAGPVPF